MAAWAESSIRRVRLAETTGRFCSYPDAVASGGLVFTSGARASSPGAGFSAMPAAAREREQGFSLADRTEGFVAECAWQAHADLQAILQAAGSDGSQILRQHIWQTDKRYFPCYEKVRMHWQTVPAPSSGLGVSRVDGPGRQWIGIDAIAVAPGESPLFTERVVMAAMDHAALPSASHYSQAVRSGPLVFTAGHIPIQTSKPGKPLVRGFADLPPEGRFLETGRSHPDSRDGPIAAQTWYVYEQLRALLATDGLSLQDAVLASVYLADVRDFAVFHRIHSHVFGARLPALCVTGFDEVGHRGTRIEIELTVLDPRAGIAPVRVDWPGQSPFAGPAAVRVGSFAFLSGLVGALENGRLANTADLPPGWRRFAEALDPMSARMAAQSWAAFHGLDAVLRAVGGSLERLGKLTVYLRQERELAAFEAIRAEFLPRDALPAFECVCIPGPGPVGDAEIQLDAIALV